MEFVEQARKLREKVDELYIYGIGLYGRTMYQTMVQNKIEINGFTITSCKENQEIFGYPVVEIREIIKKNVGLVLGLNKFNTLEVLEFLEKRAFDMDRVLYRKEFVRNGDTLNRNPMMEITTKIGCKVNCRYCPQNLLINSYFRQDKYRKTLMEIEDFKKCLDKLPINCDVIFCGMSEPLLNPQCVEMMQVACDTGRLVELFTTLVGASMEDVDKICDLPLNLVTLHVADRFGHAYIPTSENYYKMVEKMINARRKDGTKLVNNCSSQGEPDERIKEICAGRCEIITTLHDRAGNLEGDNLMKQERLQGKISCSFCGKEMNRNILLPDGTVLLCCMDYGMKHSLGNLLEETYDELMYGEVMQNIKKGIAGDEQIELLCRMCSQAHNVE